MNNGLTINKNINPSDKLLRKTFNKNIKYKYNDQLSTVIIYHILTSSLEISARSDFSIKHEKKLYQEYCCDDEPYRMIGILTSIVFRYYYHLINTK